MVEVDEVVDRLRHLHVEYVESGNTSSKTNQAHQQVNPVAGGAQRAETESEFELEGYEQVDDGDDFAE